MGGEREGEREGGTIEVERGNEGSGEGSLRGSEGFRML